MAKSIRIGILGLTHDHVWGNIKDIGASGRAELVAIADSHPPLLEQAKEQFGCRTHSSFDGLLDAEKVDAVYVFTNNRDGATVSAVAASRGIHVLIEKPMAADLEGADSLLAAARNSGSRVMVNWPFAWWPQMQQALKMVRDGAIGDIWQVKYRSAHAGPREIGCSPSFYMWLYDRHRNGAGALMDYCCYGAALARCILGLPSRVVGVAGRLCKEDILVEDNAVLVMSYPRAMAITEGSWTQIGEMTAYIAAIYGTRGTLLVEPGGGRLLLATGTNNHGSEVAVPAKPPERQNATNHFLHCLETGEPFIELCQDRIGRDAQEILAAGLLSASQGKEVSLPLRVN
jgi:predicted dehydrogenase